MRDARPRADEEARGATCVHGCESAIKEELDRVNEHVHARLELLESVSSDACAGELLRCSAECGSLNTFVHSKRDALLKVAKKFDEKLRSASGRCTARVNMQMLETAPFCTSFLERMLNVQIKLEEWALTRREVNPNLRQLLTEAYEAAAGLSENESPHVFNAPILAPNAPRMSSRRFSPLRQAQDIRLARPPTTRPPAAELLRLQGRAFERRRGAAQRLQTAASLEIFTVEVRPPAAKELTRQIAVPLFMRRGKDDRGVAGDLARVPPSAKGAEGAPGGAAKPPPEEDSATPNSIHSPFTAFEKTAAPLWDHETRSRRWTR